MRARADGFALVAVLVVLTVAAGLAALALALTNTGVTGAVGYAAEMEGGHAAAAGVRLAAIRLVDSEGYDIATAAREPLEWMGWIVTVRIEDEAGKLDLNRTPRDALARALRTDLPVADVRGALAGPVRRFASVDELAGRLRLDPDAVAAMRRRYTIYGGDAPQPELPRSPLETYRIVAVAQRGGRSVTRWAIVRISAGFGTPFEWLEQGQERDATKVTRKFTQN